MEQTLTFLFGIVIGSGINALDWRESNDKSWLFDRSQCPDCGHQLSWWELIPLVSFFLLGRKCLECGKPISWRYPLVEFTGGLLFVLLFQQFGISLAGIFAAIIWSVLLFIYVHDGRTMIIPRWAVWLFNGLAFASLFLVFPADSLAVSQAGLQAPGWLEALSGPIIATPLVAIWLVSGGRAMGLGDGKLALGIGWLLSLLEAVSAVMLAFWIGALVSLALIGLQRMWKSATTQKITQSIIKLDQPTDLTEPEEKNTDKDGSSDSGVDSAASDQDITMKTAVPFGPFLILGLLIIYFTGLTLL